jgi:hypothetical protein
LVEALQAAATKAKRSDGSIPSSLCCQIHPEHANRMRLLIHEAVEQGRVMGNAVVDVI